MESSGIKWNQVESSGIKWNQVESSGIKTRSNKIKTRSISICIVFSVRELVRNFWDRPDLDEIPDIVEPSMHGMVEVMKRLRTRMQVL